MIKKINWDTLYNDLPTHVATALRTARIKPEQLITKTEGELMAIEGIKEEDVTSIRAIYNAENITSINKALNIATKAEIAAEAAVEAAKEDESAEEEVVEKKAPKAARVRSARYQRMLKTVNKDQSYLVSEAVEKLALLAKSSKLKTVELNINTRDTGIRGEAKLPHSTGKEVKIAIFSDEVAEKITKGTIDFDILLATPADMPKLAKFAKVLGPKGIMPNPRNGTVTPDPIKRSAELSAGGTLPYKTEGKFPIIHLSMGPITQDKSDLTDNINEALRSIGIAKIKTAYISCTHTPSVKLSFGAIV
jgi:large subunit ribosomal protein L1